MTDGRVPYEHRAARATWRARRTAMLLALAVGLAVGPLAASGAQAQPASALPLTMSISQLTPTAPQAGELLTVAGIIANPSGTDADGLTVALSMSLTPLVSRADLLAVASATDHFPSVPVGNPQPVSHLAAAGKVPYQLDVPIDDLQLTTPGVYRIAVEVFHTVDDTRVYDARVDTFLPWLPPSAAVPPVHIAWLWPLLGTPHLQPDNTFSDDSLRADIAPRGRLGLLLGVATQAAGQSGTIPNTLAPVLSAAPSKAPAPTPVPIRPVPVTPVIDPENIQELELMADATGPYSVKPPGAAQAAPGTGQSAAAGYLGQLKALMAKSSSIAVPYADPDIEALTRASAAALVTQARSTGLESGLPGIVPGLLWPPDGALSENTLNQLTTSGLVLSAAALPISGGTSPAYTPTAPTTVARAGGTVSAVVIDDGLSKLVTKRIHVADRVLAMQRYAAETAAIALEGGSPARTLVVAPTRRWSPTDTAIRALLTETGTLPWLTPESVPQALQDAADPAVTRGPLREPANLTALPTGLAGRIAGDNAELGGFRSILCPPVEQHTGGTATPRPAVSTSAPIPRTGTPSARPTGAVPPCNPDDLVLPLQRTLYRAGSVAFRKPDSGGEALLTSTEDLLRKLEGKVRITTNGEKVLIGSRAKVPISIVNDLPPGTTVQVQLVLRSASRALRPATKPELVTIAAGVPVQVNVTVTVGTAGGGSLPLDAQLLTVNGRDLGAPAKFHVRVSGVGAIVVWISIAVGGLLVLAVIVRIYRRIRNARRGDTGEGGEGDGDAEPEALADLPGLPEGDA